MKSLVEPLFLLQFHPIHASEIPIIWPSSRPFRMILPIFHEIKSLIWLNRHFYTDEIRCNFHCVFGSMNCHAKPIRVTQCPSASQRISRYIFDSYLHTPNRLSQSYQTDTFCYGNRLALFQWLAIKCECFHRIIRCPISRLSLVQFSQLQKWCENEWRQWTRAPARFHFYLT